MTPSQFCAHTLPLAATAATRYPINPIAAIAQSALETGWGRSVPGNMYFGIKATPSWTGPTQQLRTTEYVNGQKVTVTSTFRAYHTPQDSFIDYASLITSLPRYNAATAFTRYDLTTQYINAIADGGYSTSPAYATTLRSIADTIKAHIPETLLDQAITNAKKKDSSSQP